MEQELERANAIFFECNILHDEISGIYEHLVDKEYDDVKRIIKQCIKHLNQIQNQMEDEI